MVRRTGIAGLVVLFVCAHMLMSADAPGTAARHPHTPASPKLRAGVLRQNWQIKPEGAVTAALVVGRTLVIVRGDRLEGRDWATGELIWRNVIDGVSDETIPALFQMGDLIAVGYTPEGDRETVAASTLLTLNARTGAMLWDLALGAEETDTDFALLGAGAGRVVVEERASGKVIRGLDGRDGSTVWQSSPPQGCAFDVGGAGGLMAAVLMRCGRDLRLRVLDLAEGRVRWERRLRPMKDVTLTVQGGAVSVGDHSGGMVYDATGRLLTGYAGALGEASCECQVAIGSEVIAVSLQDGDLSQVSVINRTTGKRRSWRIRLQALEVFDGQVYLEASVPGFSTSGVIQWAAPDGHLDRVAAYRMDGEGPHILAGAAGAFLIGQIVFGVEPLPSSEPGLLTRGGVPASRWPDACALITSRHLARLVPGSHYTAHARSGPEELGLTQPVGCDLESTNGDEPPIAITVEWASPTTQDARSRMERLRHEGFDEAVPMPGIGDEAFARQLTPDLLVMRVGRVIVRLDIPGRPPLVQELGRKIARNLKEAA